MAERTLPDGIVVPGTRNIENASSLTFEIASLANQVDALACNLGEVNDVDTAVSLICALREAIRKVGWMADLASEHLGGLVVVGDAQDWLLAPTSVGKPSRHDLNRAQ